MSIRFAQFFLISIRFAKGHSLHHMLRGSAEGVVCANNGHLIRRYYQAAHFCQTNSRLFLHWKTFRTSSNKPSFAAGIFLGAHYDNINFVNKQDYFLKIKMVEGIPNLYESQNAVERKVIYLKTKAQCKRSPWIVHVDCYSNTPSQYATFNRFVAVFGFIWL